MPKGNPVLKGRRAPGDLKPSKKVMKMRKRRSRWPVLARTAGNGNRGDK